MPLVLGLDPGSRLTGYCFLEGTSDRPRVVQSGVLKSNGATIYDRIFSLETMLARLLDQFHPELAAVERIFLGKNVDSAFKLGHARGVLVNELRRREIGIREWSPREVKKGIVGSGSAKKEQVQIMICALLSVPSVQTDDESDAMALALHQLRMSELDFIMQRGLAPSKGL